MSAWAQIGAAAVGSMPSPSGFAMSQAAAGTAWSRQKRVLQEGIRWRVADLKAAGLNPILAAGAGLGAGGAPSVNAGWKPDTIGHSAAGISRAVTDEKTGKKTRSVAEKQVANLDSSTALNSAKALESSALREESMARREKEMAATEMLRHQAVGAMYNAQQAGLQIERMKVLEEFAKEHPEVYKWGEFLGNTLGPGTGLMGLLGVGAGAWTAKASRDAADKRYSDKHGGVNPIFRRKNNTEGTPYRSPKRKMKRGK